MASNEIIETVVIGGGQAGLVVGYNLRRAGRRFVILEAHPRVGDSWRNRWDSLRAFSPNVISALDGMPLPGPRWAFPTKDQLADYFERYATHFELPVRTGVTVTRVSRDGQRFIVETSGGRIESDNVVIASGHEHAPKIPAFARDLDPTIMQLHSKDFRRPSQLRPGPALVVGSGNSGAEIALDISRTHQTFLSGRYRRAPFGPSRHPLMTLALAPIVFHVLTIDTPIGRKIGPKLVRGSAPVERIRQKALLEAGIEMVPRTIGVHEGAPVLDGGRTLDVTNVIWATGYRSELAEWIDLPIFHDDGEPRQRRGIVPSMPGLYFVGRFFQYSFMSSLLGGVSRDAAYVVRHMLARRSAPQRSTAADAVREGA